MPIAINGSGTVTGISAGGLPDACITTDELASTVNVAKAWVNFNGTGVVAIRASYNVSSITDNGTGDYTVNFTTAFADANYACSALSQFAEDGANPADIVISIARQTGAYTASSVRVSAYAASTTSPYDQTRVCVAIFR